MPNREGNVITIAPSETSLSQCSRTSHGRLLVAVHAKRSYHELERVKAAEEGGSVSAGGAMPEVSGNGTLEL